MNDGIIRPLMQFEIMEMAERRATLLHLTMKINDGLIHPETIPEKNLVSCAPRKCAFSHHINDG